MRLAVLADIHGNALALEAVRADMATRQIDAVVNLGDCVSGPLWPRETLDILRQAGWPTVRGNHDRYVATGTPDTLGGSDLTAWSALDDGGRAWLRELPQRLDLPGGTVAFHARPQNDEAYLLEDQWGGQLVEADHGTVAHRLRGIDARLVLTAHSHLPRAMRLPDGRWVVNPGSVGCPAYDDDGTDPPHISQAGSPAARYAIVQWTAQGLMSEFLSVPYPHEEAAMRAEASGRPGWAYALRTGFVIRPIGDTP